MTKRLTIALIALLAFAMIAMLPAAALNVVPPGGTVFRGEEGLNIGAGMPAPGTLVWFSPGATPGVDAPSKSVTVANPASFYVDPTMEVGAWYDNAGPFVAAAILVADPHIDIQIRNENNNVVNDKSVIRGEQINFRIVSNLDAFATRGAPSAAPSRVRITDPNGNVYHEVIDQNGFLVDLRANVANPNTLINTNPFSVIGGSVFAQPTWVWDTANAQYSRGTYTIRVDCDANAMNTNYGVTGKTVSKSYSLTIVDDDLVITSNKDTVVRNNDFAVTVQGRPNENYVMWVKGTAALWQDFDPVTGTPAEWQVPWIKDGQQGVFKWNFVETLAPIGVDAPIAPVVAPANAIKGELAARYEWGAGRQVRHDVPPQGVIVARPTLDESAMVTLGADGRRIVGFGTDQTTKDQSFTIRVQEYLPFGISPDYDEVKVRVEAGAVTITAAGDRQYYLGQEVLLSGTNTDSNQIFLFITGPNLAANGAQLDNPTVPSITGVPGTFVQRNVRGDDTWDFRWRTGEIMIDPGTYTIYAVSQANNKGDLTNVKYATVSVVIRKGFITATPSATTVAKGDKVFIRGTAEGDPDNVGVWMFGINYYGPGNNRMDTTNVEDDSTFEFEISGATTSNLAAGQYFIVVQHPMANRLFDVQENPVGANVFVQTRAFSPIGVAPVIGANAFQAVGNQRLQGSDAAEALTRMLDLQQIDDTYTKLTFLVEEPWIRIDSIGDKYVGSQFTVTGTTNLAVDNELIVEVTSSAFRPTDKTASGEFAGTAGVVRVIRGDAGYNTWSMEVDATGFLPDEYIVKVESIEADASQTTTFNVLEGVPVTPAPATPVPATPVPATPVPTQPPATPASPGFGALVAIAGLGAVAFLVLRRD